jgi:hypothetical protein
VTPHSNESCLEIFIFGEIVIIFAEGLMAEINLAVYKRTRIRGKLVKAQREIER